MLQAPKIPAKLPPKTPKNPSHTPKNFTTLKFNKIPPQNPQNHHKIFQWIATNLHACALQILAMMNSIPCHTDEFCYINLSFVLLKVLVILSFWRSIHKFKVCLKFFGFFLLRLCLATRWVAFYAKAQNDKNEPKARVYLLC